MNKKLTMPFFLILGFILGYWYQDSSNTYHAEELIGKEVALLESSKAIPDCDLLVGADSHLKVTKQGETIIVWQFLAETEQIRKVVVDKAMTVAYDEYKSSCH